MMTDPTSGRRQVRAIFFVALAAMSTTATTAGAASLVEQLMGLPCGKGLAQLNSEMEAGNAEANSVAGLFFDRGICVEEDAKRAALLYQRASDKGSRFGTEGLAFLFAAGRGVDQDYGSAGALLRTAGSTKDEAVTAADFTRGYAFAMARQSTRELEERMKAIHFAYINEVFPPRLVVRFDTTDPEQSISLPKYHETSLSADSVAQRALIRQLVADALASARYHLPVFDTDRYPNGTFQFRMTRVVDRQANPLFVYVDQFESVPP